ncbi:MULTISPECIES: MMPL family transporter [Niallia]|uniref:MMPL family transporter n=1 Tax=Niallia TaxID=2837506 RepID=UPI002E2265C8|nr:MMPL family transporter [Niallia circulans]
MAKFLYSIGEWAFNHRKKVLSGSLIILVSMVIIALSVKPSFQNEITIPGTKSEAAGELLKEEFQTGESPENGQVQLVMKAPKGKTLETDEVNEQIKETLNDIKRDKKVTEVATPSELGNLNESKEIGYATVTFKIPADEVSEESKENILEKIEQTRGEGIETEIAGNVAFSEMEIGGITEVIGVAIAFLVLAITFVSFLVAGLPIITAAIGLGIGLMMIMIGTKFFEITSFSLSLAAMLGLAVGIDYALFIISRFRQQLQKGNSVKKAIAIATATAGSAVVFAGLTVIIGLLGLAVAKIPFLTAMGIAAAVCVLIAIIIATVLVPALLAIYGDKLHPSKKNKLIGKFSKENKESSLTSKWGKMLSLHPMIISILSIAFLLFVTIPFFHMELGLPDNETKSEKTTERRAYDLLSEAYGPGYHASLIVIAKVSEKTENAEQALTDVTNKISELENVKAISPAIPSPSGEIFMINVTPETGPNDVKTKDLVHSIRNHSSEMEKEYSTELFVTGATAVNIDISDKLNEALPIFSILIVGLAFILLVVVFRSILVPLKAVLGFILSLGATLGFVVFVVQDGNFLQLFGFNAANPVLCFLPVIVIGILFGLAMDYEVFLVSRIREEYSHSGDAKKAVLVGLQDSGRVVIAAGFIMMAVFAGFMLAPDPIIKSMGFALTFGVLFDAFIVRMTIVPAIMILMGKTAWYLPKWLDKILPRIDIEGESIMQETEEKDVESNLVTDK